MPLSESMYVRAQAKEYSYLVSVLLPTLKDGDASSLVNGQLYLTLPTDQKKVIDDVQSRCSKEILRRKSSFNLMKKPLDQGEVKQCMSNSFLLDSASKKEKTSVKNVKITAQDYLTPIVVTPDVYDKYLRDYDAYYRKWYAYLKVKHENQKTEIEELKNKLEKEKQRKITFQKNYTSEKFPCNSFQERHVIVPQQNYFVSLTTSQVIVPNSYVLNNNFGSPLQKSSSISANYVNCIQNNSSFGDYTQSMESLQSGFDTGFKEKKFVNSAPLLGN